MMYKIQSLKELKKFAEQCAKKVVRKRTKNRGALVLGLVGDLGAGKTTFTQAFLRSLGTRGRITSPTFVIIKNYKLRIKNYARAYHVDAYRIKKPKELATLGFKKILADPKNIVVIEWADRVKKILPKHTLWFYFEHGGKANERIIKISS